MVCASFGWRRQRRTQASGRLAQRERRTLTRSRSGVQIPHRPPSKPQAIGTFPGGLFAFLGALGGFVWQSCDNEGTSHAVLAFKIVVSLGSYVSISPISAAAFASLPGAAVAFPLFSGCLRVRILRTLRRRSASGAAAHGGRATTGRRLRCRVQRTCDNGARAALPCLRFLVPRVLLLMSPCFGGSRRCLLQPSPGSSAALVGSFGVLCCHSQRPCRRV